MFMLVSFIREPNTVLDYRKIRNAGVCFNWWSSNVQRFKNVPKIYHCKRWL